MHRAKRMWQAAGAVVGKEQMALLKDASGRSFEASARGSIRPGTTACVCLSYGGCIPDLGWEQFGGESVPAVAGVVYRLWARRSAGARPGRTVESASWGGYEGRHKGEEREERSEERMPQFCLSGTGSDTGGAWFGKTRSIGHLSRIPAHGRRGMFLGGRCGGGAPAQGRAE